ncbi:MAG: hypothetical protein KJ779_13490, partial [Firmicutes bacterium]|nr:hypothetical protein [Bacillota bacterium]
DEAYEHGVFKYKSIEHEVYCKRILGLLCIDEDHYVNLLMKEAFGKLHHYLTTREEIYELNKIIDLSIGPKPGAEAPFNMMTIVCFYTKKLGHEIDDRLSMRIHERMLKERLRDFESDAANEAMKRNKRQCQHVWLKFCSHHGLAHKITKLDDFLGPLYEVDDGKRIEDERLARLHLIPLNMQYQGMDSIYLGGCKLTDGDIYSGVLSYINTNPKGKVPDYDAMLVHMIFSLYTITLVKEYKKVKDYYFKHNQETVFREMENFEHTIKELNKSREDLSYGLVQANSERQKVSEENQRLKQKSRDEEKAKMAEVAHLRKNMKAEIDALENTLKKERERSLENEMVLKRLEKLLFPTPPVPGRTHETAAEEINQYKKILYAVSPGWGDLKIKGLKEKLPNLGLYEGIFPEKAEAVFIDYQLISHSDYNKVITQSKRKKIPYYYIQSTGVGETICEMVETLRNESLVIS